MKVKKVLSHGLENCCSNKMMNRYEMRRAKLKELISEIAGGNASKFARLHDYSRSQMSQFLSASYNDGRSIGDVAARQIESRARKPAGWLDGYETATVQATAEEPWPFSCPYSDYVALQEPQRQALDRVVSEFIKAFATEVKSKKAAKTQ